MHEDQWIAEIVRRFAAAPGAGHLGPGDDAALLPSPGDGQSLVFTTDSMVEDTHFRAHWLSDAELAMRALAVSLSDLAAMGARPVGALLSIETPELPGHVGAGFMDGVEGSLARWEFPLLGGNVTRTRGPLVVTSTLIGTVATGCELRRDGAEPGDQLWVTGRPGAAVRARRLLEDGTSCTAPETAAWRSVTPRLEAAQRWLERARVERRWRSAAIDISDGLGIDLVRLLRASRVGAVLELAPLLIPDEQGEPTLMDVLEGGEDYELLVTAPPEADPEEVQGTLAGDGCPATCIGQLTEAGTVAVRVRGESVHYRARGWDPFADQGC